MTQEDPSHLALFTKLGNLIGKHSEIIYKVAAVVGVGLTLIQLFFDVQLSPYGPVFIKYLTSDAAIVILLLTVMISQIMLYQRVEWIVKQLERDVEPDKESGDMSNSEDTMTDGGWRDQPRDDKGRFTTKESGGTNLFILILAGVLGYTVGTEIEAISPIVGVLIAIAIVAFLQTD